MIACQIFVSVLATASVKGCLTSHTKAMGTGNAWDGVILDIAKYNTKHDIVHSTTSRVEFRPDFEFIKDTPYPALTGELCGVFRELP